MILGKNMLINLTVKDVSVSYLSINIQYHNCLFIFSFIQLFCIALCLLSVFNKPSLYIADKYFCFLHCK